MDPLARSAQYAKLVEERLGKVLSDVEPASLGEAVRHYPLAGGKRFRPALAMAACEAVGGTADAALPLACAVEMVHNFSLVHDDIMDRDPVRRGLPAVHVKFGEPAAILAGDTLFAVAFEEIARLRCPPAVRVDILADFARATRVLCEGQQMDMEFAGREVGREEYLEMIYRKTAALYETAARNGALCGGGSHAAVEALSAYGRAFGMAFQVRDDLLGVVSTEKKTGKPKESDIRNGKRTLILLTALQNADDEQRALLESTVGNANATPARVARVHEIFLETGAVDDAVKLTERYHQEAVEALEPLPANPAREFLVRLAEHAGRREA
ncbi:MAG TPA: polyprenyl synthetase family protein [Candidatus Thermoplasmatota archaeon]|nr:polyprenyl synthetase family protein [Candidatus Thermoplasmatota archaeon]